MDEEMADRLYEACFNSNWTLVKDLLQQGAPVNYTHPKNAMTSLYVAIARKAPLDVIQLMIRDHSADPNQGDGRGFTPLHAACEYRASLEIVKFLLAMGADPNQPAQDGATAVHFAAQFLVRISVLRALLSAGGNPNALKINGASPLFSAVENGASAAFVRVLLSAGASPHLKIMNPRTQQVDTPLSIAKRKCSADVVALIEEQQNNRNAGFKAISDSGNFAEKAEKARLLFRHAVTSNSLLTVSETHVIDNGEGEETMPLREGERVVLVHGSLEEGLHAPYENYVLVTTYDGKAGRVPKQALFDHAAVTFEE